MTSMAVTLPTNQGASFLLKVHSWLMPPHTAANTQHQQHLGRGNRNARVRHLVNATHDVWTCCLILSHTQNALLQ